MFTFKKALIALLVITTSIAFQGCPALVPQADFYAEVHVGEAPLEVAFTNQTQACCTSRLKYCWDFGDGTTSSETAPTHIYETPGEYTVSLTAATWLQSDTETKVAYILVTESGGEEGEGEGEGEGAEEGEEEGEVLEPGTIRAFADIEFVWVPAGTFTMGTDKTSEELSALYGDFEFLFRSEQPAHTVTISQGFWLGRYEVTQSQWESLMGDNPSEYRGANRPVEMLSWDACQEFILKLNQQGAGVFRLPTEAEWEYACRAGSTGEFCFGDAVSTLGEYAWYFDNSVYTTHEVGKKKANAWGLYDMHGNVFEWCHDWHAEDYYSVSPAIDPQGPETGTFRVRRGGTYSRVPSYCRSSFRYWNRPDARLTTQGFRLCRQAD